MNYCKNISIDFFSMCIVVKSKSLITMGASKSSFSSRSKVKSKSETHRKRKSAKGGWSNQLYFDPEADNEFGINYYIEHEGLGKLSTLVDAEERILNVYAYKVPLNNWQLTSFTMYHLFIIFKTKSWWWSIEKHSDCISIQRSKLESAVRCKHIQTYRRTPINLVKSDSGSKSVNDLICWLYNKNELNKEFDELFSNCKTCLRPCCSKHVLVLV